jgi:hypothetical protein
MRPQLVIVTCALVALLGSTGAGCAEDEPDPVTAAELPENLCAAVPDSVVARWTLTEADHATEAADDRSEASCSMTGTVDDDPVTLDITLTSYGGLDPDAVRTLVADDLAARCDELEQTATGRFDDEKTRCSTEARGAVTEISRSVPAHGVVTVTMTHDGQLSQLVPAEVVGISGTVANSDPADLS